ncbi:MAG TPA: hypothetical protein EYP59_21085 [Thiotrichaceae bacterium]|nr:hypothetical protein [Thiotrichaceae bacterium]
MAISTDDSSDDSSDSSDTNETGDDETGDETGEEETGDEESGDEESGDEESGEEGSGDENVLTPEEEAVTSTFEEVVSPELEEVVVQDVINQEFDLSEDIAIAVTEENTEVTGQVSSPEGGTANIGGEDVSLEVDMALLEVTDTDGADTGDTEEGGVILAVATYEETGSSEGDTDESADATDGDASDSADSEAATTPDSNYLEIYVEDGKTYVTFNRIEYTDGVTYQDVKFVVLEITEGGNAILLFQGAAPVEEEVTDDGSTEGSDAGSTDEGSTEGSDDGSSDDGSTDGSDEGASTDDGSTEGSDAGSTDDSATS